MNRRKVTTTYWQSKQAHLFSMFLNNEAEALDSRDRPEIMRLLPSLEGKRVIDLAAGIGRFTGEFAKTAKKVVAIDLSPKFIEANRQTHSSFSNIEWICSDAMDVDFPKGSFDLVFISWLFMYLKEEEIQLLSERIKKWLKPGGILFFRESCAAVTYFSKIAEYYAHYRSPIDYDRLFNQWTPLKQGHSQTYEELLADPFKCFWIYQNDRP